MSLSFAGGITPGYLYDLAERHYCKQDSIFYWHFNWKISFPRIQNCNDRAETRKRSCLLVCNGFFSHLLKGDITHQTLIFKMLKHLKLENPQKSHDNFSGSNDSSVVSVFYRGKNKPREENRASLYK